MKDFIEYLAKQIVSKPEEVEITVEKGNDFNTYSIKANKDDIRMLIGKGGNVIRSIRNLVKAKAIKNNEMIRILIEDENEEDTV